MHAARRQKRQEVCKNPASHSEREATVPTRATSRRRRRESEWPSNVVKFKNTQNKGLPYNTIIIHTHSYATNSRHRKCKGWGKAGGSRKVPAGGGRWWHGGRQQAGMAGFHPVLIKVKYHDRHLI